MPVVELTVDSSGASTGLKQYDTAVNKSAANTETAFSKIRSGVGAVGAVFAGLATAGVAAATTAVVAFTTALAGAGAKAKEIENLARLSGEGVEHFQNLAYAADEYGFSAEKLADASKDITEKIGDFIVTGAGPMVDFFEQIAPKIGLTAEAMAQMSGPEALQAVKNGMDELNLSAAEQSFHLETIGSDLTLLMPLLAENGKLWKEGAAHADALGIALSKVDTTNLKKGAKALADMTKMVVSLKDKVVADLAPAFTLMAEAIQKSFKETGVTIDDVAAKISGAMLSGVNDMVEVVRFLHNGFMGIHLVLLGMVVAIGEIIGAWGELTNHISSLLDKVGLDNPFKQMGKDAVLFKESAREAFNEQLKHIEDVNLAYDKTKALVDDVVEKTQELSSATEEVEEEARKIPAAIRESDIKEQELKTKVEDTTAAIQAQKAAQDTVKASVDATTNAYQQQAQAASSAGSAAAAANTASLWGGKSVTSEGLAMTQEEQDWYNSMTPTGSGDHYFNRDSKAYGQGDYHSQLDEKQLQKENAIEKILANREAQGGGPTSEIDYTAGFGSGFSNTINTFNFTESVSRSDIEGIMQDANRITARA